jgi:uncharacterized membrane protein YebE (DUF533 family)
MQRSADVRRTIPKSGREEWTLDAEDILDGVIRGALGGRRKRHRGALGYLVGGRHSLLNARNLLTAAGVAWGLYEAAQAAQGGTPLATTPSTHAPPPLPGARHAIAPAGDNLLRLVRLTISAARADGNLSLEERGRILEHARGVGLEPEVAAELQQPRPLAEIVAGVTEPGLKADLYRLAFSVVRADETVSGAERVYLAQLAARLGMEVSTTAEIEREAAAGIDAAAGEGRLESGE